MQATMSRLEQAVAIRDALLKRCPDWHRSSLVRSVVVPVPGFECTLRRYADGDSSLQIWPDSGMRLGGHTVLDDKVMDLFWDPYGRSELVSLRRPKDWMDQLLALLDPDGWGKRVARKRFKVVK